MTNDQIAAARKPRMLLLPYGIPIAMGTIATFIASGLRIFDIRDPEQPKELAYFVAPPSTGSAPTEPSNYAMSSPSFVPDRREVWYTDGNSGFYNVRLDAGVWPFAPDAGSGSARPSLGLPSNRRCVSRRRFRIRLRQSKQDPLVRATVYLGGKRVRVATGKRLTAVIDLRGLPKGKFTIRIVGVTRSGKQALSKRTYRTCRAKRRR